MYDDPSETWIPVGLQSVRVYDLVSHGSDLYAATPEGIYRAAITEVHPYNKTAVIWGAIKRP